jgi:DNA repair exonuclease SbcCD ATPase subunit
MTPVEQMEQVRRRYLTLWRSRSMIRCLAKLLPLRSFEGGAKSGNVTCKLHVGDAEITVVRSRPKGVKFFLAGLEQQWTQEEWEKKLKLSYAQFMVSMYCVQGGSGRFLGLNDSDKKTFLLELMDLDEFAEAKRQAEAFIKALSADVDAISLKLEGATSKVDAYSESLVDEVIIAADIAKQEALIADSNKIIAEHQLVVKPDFAKYIKLEQDLIVKQTEFTEIRTRRSMLHEQYRKLSAKMKPFAGSSSCYACGSALNVSDAKAAHEHETSTVAVELASLKKQIDDCDEHLAKENSILDVQRKLKDRKANESAEYEAAVKAIREQQAFVQAASTRKENLALKLQNNAELLNKIQALKSVSEKLVISLANNKRNIELYKTVAAMYAPTGAQAYVLDSLVESFNETVINYVNLVWPNASYKLNSYRENAKGDVTAKFSETLTMDAKEVSVGSLSGGELKALSLCADFAILDILEQNFGMSLNPIILDEPFDGLDSVGRELVIELLEKLALSRQIFVVDHASEAKAMFSKIIKVEKKNGTSEVSIDL